MQLDEVLTSLQSDSREDLQQILTGLNTALTSKPTAAENADADPLAQGQTAAESFNDALDDIPVAERSSAQVFEALLGTEPTRDLTRLIRGTARTAEELSRYEQSLQDLITNLNATTGALASEATNLRTSIRELPPHAGRGQQRVQLAQRGVPADARVRAPRSARACARRRPRSTPRSRGSSRPARSCSRRSSAGWPRSSRRPRSTSRA